MFDFQEAEKEYNQNNDDFIRVLKSKNNEIKLEYFDDLILILCTVGTVFILDLLYGFTLVTEQSTFCNTL